MVRWSMKQQPSFCTIAARKLKCTRNNLYMQNERARMSDSRSHVSHFAGCACTRRLILINQANTNRETLYLFLLQTSVSICRIVIDMFIPCSVFLSCPLMTVVSSIGRSGGGGGGNAKSEIGRRRKTIVRLRQQITNYTCQPSTWAYVFVFLTRMQILIN
jgi:hypothetical protein